MDKGNANANSQKAEDTYEAWMKKQAAGSKGERKRRLNRDSNHSEKQFALKVWLEAFGHFARLHAEYEVRDFKDGWRYLDFAYLVEGFKIAIEIDGFGSHSRDIDRKQFSDHLMRQNHLVIDGWQVLRFSYDDIMERPRMCQQLIQQLIGKLSSVRNVKLENPLALPEQAIVKLALTLDKPLTPKFAAERLGLHRVTVGIHLKALAKKQLLVPTKPDAKRVCGYRINKSALTEYSLIF